MTQSALVIHSDERQRRLIGDALLMFRPGYRVSTADHLASATDWLEAVSPDLVVIDGSIAPPNELDTWAVEHDLGSYRTVVVGPTSANIDAYSSASVCDPITLPKLLAAVRDTMRGDRVPPRNTTMKDQEDQ